jgi:long-chain acyl-CoA synthetase
MGLRDHTLFDVISRNALLYPGRTAIVFEGKRITHREHFDRVERLAAGLAAAGVEAGDRIGIVSLNCPEYLDLYGAASRLGAIVLPVNWRLSPDEIVQVLDDASPKLVFADAEHRQVVEAALDRLALAPRLIGIGAAQAPFIAYEELLRASPPIPETAGGSDDGYVIMHTAAVAGEPRGAVITQRGLLAAGTQMVHQWRLGPDDAQLGVLPLYHITALGLFVAVMQAGGCTALSARFDPAAAAREIARERVSVFGEFAPMLGLLMDRAEESSADLSSLRVVFGLDTPETIGRFERACPNARFWVGYGQSEVSGGVTFAPFRERPGSAGRPALLSTVAVVDELDRPLPVGETGEIVVRGPMVFKGYWNRETDNEFTFRNGWHHTGDMGRFDGDGYLWYAGRAPAKELIKPGGENVYPAEVERAILEHPAIAEAVVFGVPDAHWGEAVKAVCVRAAGQNVGAEELIEFVGRRIARFKKPKHVTFVAQLPRSGSGQIDRAAVKLEHGAA